MPRDRYPLAPMHVFWLIIAAAVVILTVIVGAWLYAAGILLF